MFTTLFATLFAPHTPNGTRKPLPVGRTRNRVVAAALFTLVLILILFAAMPSSSSLAQTGQKGSSLQTSLPAQGYQGTGGRGGPGYQPPLRQRPSDPAIAAKGDKGEMPGTPPSPFGTGFFDQNAPTTITENNWTNLFPPLSTISAASTGEAWARGDNQGELLHFSAGAWTTVTPTVLSGLYIEDIKMVSPSDGWLSTLSGTSPYNGHVFRYDGTNWTEMSAGLGSTLRVYSLAVASDTNIWATGAVCSGGSSCTSSLVHWDGTNWTSAGPTLGSGEYLYSIAFAGPNEGWAVGTHNGTPSTALVFHYNGTTWAPINPPSDALYLQRIGAGAPGEAWAIGENSTFHFQLYHYSGGTWSEQATPDGSAPQGIFMLSATQGWLATSSGILSWNGTAWTPDYTGRSMRGVSAVNGRVWAAGDAGSILSKTGAGSWTLQRGGPTTEYLQGVSTLSTDEAWAVGGNGTFLHYLNRTWQAVSTPFTDTILAIQMLSPSDGYAVGNHLIAHWNGTQWTRVATPDHGVFALAMTSSGEGWAVGSAGEFWHATGGIWSLWPERGPSLLLGIAMDSPTHGWAVGGISHGALLEYTGGSWVDRSSMLPADVKNLQGITTGPGPDEAWAGVWYNTSCSDPALLHYTNGTWSWVPGVTACSISGFAHEALGELWAGGGYPVYHYSGGAWHSVNIPAYIWPLQGISLVPGRGGWAVGYDGQIIQYSPLAPGQTFYDVPPDSTFYSYINCMVSQGIISGYPADNTFRPNSNVTRGQLAKIVSNSAAFTDTQTIQLFQDIPVSSPFFAYVGRLASRGYMSGYACGGTGEPCGPNNLPYFRPNRNATRGQISKIVSNAAGFSDTPTGQQFEDVAEGSTYYTYTYRLVSRSIMSGYQCGGANEPCIPPSNLPYFRPNNNATRGQTSKIVANTFFPNCQQLLR
jgi:hypothetical protein